MTTSHQYRNELAQAVERFMEYKGIRVEVRNVTDDTATIYPNTGDPMRDLYNKSARVPLAELKAVTE